MATCSPYSGLSMATVEDGDLPRGQRPRRFHHKRAWQEALAELMEGSGARSYPHVVCGRFDAAVYQAHVAGNPGSGARAVLDSFGVIDAEQRACTASASSADLVRASAIVKAEFNGPLALRMVPEGNPRANYHLPPCPVHISNQLRPLPRRSAGPRG
jgi:hypothetical protein